MLAALAFIIIALRPHNTATRSLARGGSPVPSTWRATRIAVGTALADGPPHRSQRAGLPHWAPALGAGVEAHLRIGMHDADGR
jgi:hypothetical protein